MDILSDLVGMMARAVLPQGHTHAHIDQRTAVEDGRVDVLVSHAVAGEVSMLAVENPMVGLLFDAARPVIDGALTACVGPVAIRGALGGTVAPLASKRKRSSIHTTTTTGSKVTRSHRATTTKSTAVVKSKRGAKAPPEIIDAEFVDLPYGAEAPHGGRNR